MFEGIRKAVSEAEEFALGLRGPDTEDAAEAVLEHAKRAQG